MLNVAILILTCFVNLLLGTFVLLRNPKQRKGIVFFLVCVFVSLWAVCNYIAADQNFALTFNNVFNRAAFVFGFLAIATGLWFTYVFPIPFKISNIVKNLLILSVIFVSLLSCTTLISGQVTEDVTGLKFSLGPLLFIYALISLIFLVLLAKNLLKAITKSQGREKQQAIYILIGLSMPIILGLTTNAILPLFTSSFSVAVLGPSFTILFVVTASYAIVRHSLFDIRFFVVRAAAYFLTLFAMTFALVLPVVLLFGHFLNFHPSIGQLALVVLLSVCVLYFLQYVRKLFDRFTSRIFFRYYYDFQDVVDKISDVLVRTSDLEIIQNETTRILKHALRTDTITYVLSAYGNEHALAQIKKITDHKFDATTNVIDVDEVKSAGKNIVQNESGEDMALVVRLRTTEGSLGYLLLGHKQSGEMYASRDVKLLNIIADEIAISIQNALRFKEIQGFNVTLQDKIDDATHKLRDTNKRLKLLDETKDDFISMASHQLRTPLTSVKGYLSLVLDGDAGQISESQRKLLTQAFFSSQRMVFLIADLLNVSRLKTGKFIIERTMVNLADIIEQELAQLVETAKSRGLTLEFHKPEHFPDLNIDETKTRQVIMNFCDNAIYYTPAGGHIQVVLQDLDKSIEWKVVDDGIGVPKEDQHHLFSKFYRAKNAQKARPDGTGLGLFMAKKIIVAQGGAIIFNSQEGKGSTFGFTFPKAGITEPTPSAQSLSEPHPTVTKTTV